ncbi:MAG: peptidylprolyl isomerase [Acidobacteriota bacterium]|nr:peptidylprolyl isomerase [Acidobacteriota bacterium]
MKLSALLLFCALQVAAPPSAVRVRIDTSAGAFVVELDAARAPGTVANFLRYVDGGFYDGGVFHRTVHAGNETRPDVPVQIVQAAMHGARESEAWGAIPLERTRLTGLTHADGTISMARSAAADSARDEFFICIGDQPVLDFGGKRSRDGQGYAAFGRVISGMDVVRRIQQQPAKAQRLDPPVAIVSARRIE